MGQRKEALWRVAAFAWSFVAGFIAGFVAIVGFFWGLIDVIWQFITGSDGLSSSSTPAMWVKRFLIWPIDLLVYAFTGDGEFELLP